MDRVIAIDFDGCLCDNKYPEIGAPHIYVIRKAIHEQNHGAKLILWTCRDGPLLEAAVSACKSWGLTFDAVNDNVESWKQRYGNDTRKVGATEYWDDRAVRMDGSYVETDSSVKDTALPKIGSGITKQRLTGLQRSRRAKGEQHGHLD